MDAHWWVSCWEFPEQRPSLVRNGDDTWLGSIPTRPDRRRGTPGLHRLDRIAGGFAGRAPTVRCNGALAALPTVTAGAPSLGRLLCGRCPLVWNPCRMFSQWVPAASPRTIRATFPHAAITTEVVLFTIVEDDLCVLLVERAIDPCRGQWSLPSRFVRPGEDLEDAAARGLLAATGMEKEAVFLEQLATFGRPDRDPRMRVIAVAYWGACAAVSLPSPSAGAPCAELVPVASLEQGEKSSWRSIIGESRWMAWRGCAPNWNTRRWPPSSAVPNSQSPNSAGCTRWFGD